MARHHKKPRTPKPRKQHQAGGLGRPITPPAIGKPAPQVARPQAPAGAAPAPKARPANNTTVDIYIDPNAPPAPADTAGVACHIAPDWRLGSQNAQGDLNWRWTHVMYCNLGVDIRDGWPTAIANRVYMPDLTGTRFDVVFVETVNRGLGNSYLRVFLKRNAPTWPTANT